MRCCLVVSGGGFQGLGLIKALRAVPQTRILMIDCYPENGSRWLVDAFFEAPPLADETRFLDFASRLCAEQAIDAVFAASDHELETLAGARDRFAATGATVYVSSLDFLRLVRDKRALYGWLDAEGLPVLPVYPSPMDPQARFPLFGKPRFGWGGRETRVLRSREHYLAQQASLDPDLVWQPALQGFREYSVDFAIDPQGAVSPLGVRRRVRTLAGFAVLAAPAEDPRLRALAADLIGRLPALGGRGPFNLQILQGDEALWISDLNPRAGTSLPLSLAAGCNPIAFLLGTNAQGDEAAAPRRWQRCFRTLTERCVGQLDLSAVRGVVFDLDDTLLSQKHWMLDKLWLTWHEERAHLPPRREFLALALRIIEEGNRARLLDALCAELGLGSAMRDRLIALYRALVPERCVLYDDVLPCLEGLRRLGYKIGLLSDNPPASQRQKLEQSGLLPWFDGVVLSSELGGHSMARPLGATED